MTLSAGTRLGAYEVIAPIGAGGMGEVYRARDTRLKREVALKILPDSFASDPERLARFQREAEVLATLNHPHIAQIYGLEEAEGTPALVMELVEGETLADRIARGAISIDEALPIARQIAEALEAAHEQGIVHRDLKPANIKVRPDGTVKVLDFGLAKLVETGGAGGSAAAREALTMSPTITSPAMVTGVGTLLGTAAYMSPEQAKGRAADRRSDIWAFGCVLYEMLSSRRAFAGDDVSDTLASILKTDPAWTSLPTATPPAIRRLLRRCLERDPRRRLQAIGEARVSIEEWLGGARDEEPAAAMKPKSRTAMLAGAAAVAAVVVILGVGWTVTRRSPAAPQPGARFTIVPPAAQAIDTSGDRSLAISADGTRVVYAGGPPAAQQLFVRRIDEIDLVVLRGTEGANSPSISPDGRWVVFDARSDLKKVAIAGGAPITLCSCLGRFALRGSTWGPDNTILIATDDSATGLLSLPAGGGEAKLITTPDSGHGERDHFFPSMLPGGRVVLFTVVPFGSTDSREVVALDLSTGQRKTLIHGGSQAQYVETGHLIYADGATLRAVRFDPARLEVIGDPIPVVERVLAPSSGGSGVTGASDFSVSEDGTLVYVPGGLGGSDLARRSLVWLDRQGREEPINAPQHTYGAVRLSPAGGSVAVDVRELNTDIWTWDFARQTFTRLTFDPQPDDNPVWTPDGRRIIFRSLRGQSPEIYIEAADGTGTAERLTTESAQLIPKSIAPDGRRLVLLGQSGKTGNDLRLLTLDDNKPKTTPLLEAPANESDGDVSPDGHWLAYASDESGRSEIYVRPFPAVEAGRWQVSTAGGSVPQWARSGRELFFIDGSAAMTSVPVQTTPTFVAGQLSRLFDTRFSSGAGRRYDVTADGKRFLMVKEDAGATQGGGIASIVVVQSWFDELKRLVPVK